MKKESGFIQLINTITDLPSKQKDKFQALLSLKNIQEREHIVRAGRISRTIAFIKKGLFRYFYTTEDGVEFTKGFFD